MGNDLLDILFTSYSESSPRGFWGYSFQETDFIIGQQGFDKFLDAGRSFSNEEDGCYLRIEAINSESTRFSTDFRGYFPLFYYSFDKEWIVSPSFELVVKEASRRGWPLTLREHQFIPWKSPWSLVQMLTSKRTAFNEVQALSYDEEIIVSTVGLTVRKRQISMINNNYKDALEDLIATWSARVMTLVGNGMTIRVDLTGGVDSRTVMAFILNLLERNKSHHLLNSDSFLVNSQTNKPEDYAVAKAISNTFKFPLNNPQRKKYSHVSAVDSFAAWKQYNLGRYSPHILPSPKQDSGIITFNGIGGEEHRPFYDSFGRGSFGFFLMIYRNLFLDEAQYGAWLADLLEDIDAPITLHDTLQSAATRHYRRHRSRHHTSKQPANEMMGVFLSSRLAFECAHHMESTALADNQFLFDIMISCSSDLALMPYDKPDKGPKKANFTNLTKIDNSKSKPLGQIWRSAEKQDAKNKCEDKNEILRQSVLEALSNPKVIEVIGEDQRNQAFQQVEMLKKDNNLHQSGHLLHFVMLSELIVNHKTG